jgi:hypothetical protein
VLLEDLDGLLAAVLGDLECLFLQTFYGLAVVADDDVNYNQA